jgi:hypothetical protein
VTQHVGLHRYRQAHLVRLLGDVLEPLHVECLKRRETAVAVALVRLRHVNASVLGHHTQPLSRGIDASIDVAFLLCAAARQQQHADSQQADRAATHGLERRAVVTGGARWQRSARGQAAEACPRSSDRTREARSHGTGRIARVHRCTTEAAPRALSAVALLRGCLPLSSWRAKSDQK